MLSCAPGAAASPSAMRVARLTRQEGLSARRRRPFVRTTGQQPRPWIAPNVVARTFLPLSPNHTWASDITYIWTAKDWLYLAVMLDLFSRRVVGWSMGERIDRHLALGALNMALSGREAPAIHHSDRGTQNASEDHRQRLAEHGITCSLGRKGNYWDKAVVESFFSSLKPEVIHTCSFRMRDETRRVLFDCIEVFYNRMRRHFSIGDMRPVEYERATEALRQAA